ncbi:restriction endonuclease [Aliarcobacter butzleri]|uniref:restriction endonuclease n=1 Tax=Aliarcobacter butzleri TaxID=28197 RepID=UPI003B2166D9
MANNGRLYENFVAELQQALIDSQMFMKTKSIKIEKNKSITDRCGISREFDLYWEYEFAGVIYKNVIECKDYESKISIDKIDALLGKLHDIPGIKPIFATKTGYQRGAEKKAAQHNIDLLIVREQNDSDWEGKIRELQFMIHCQMPASILEFSPIVDKEWLDENKIDLTNYCSKVFNDEVFIDDVDKGEKYSLLELSNKLTPLTDAPIGIFENIVETKDAYIINDIFRLKLKGYKIKYEILPPIKTETIMDFSKELKGVIEYLGKNCKKGIFTDGNIKDF